MELKLLIFIKDTVILFLGLVAIFLYVAFLWLLALMPFAAAIAIVVVAIKIITEFF